MSGIRSLADLDQQIISSATHRQQTTPKEMNEMTRTTEIIILITNYPDISGVYF